MTIKTSDIPTHQQKIVKNAAKQARKAAVQAKKAELPSSFADMNPPDKDKLLHALALAAGLIDS